MGGWVGAGRAEGGTRAVAGAGSEGGPCVSSVEGESSARARASGAGHARGPGPGGRRPRATLTTGRKPEKPAYIAAWFKDRLREAPRPRGRLDGLIFNLPRRSNPPPSPAHRATDWTVTDSAPWTMHLPCPPPRRTPVPHVPATRWPLCPNPKVSAQPTHVDLTEIPATPTTPVWLVVHRPC